MRSERREGEEKRGRKGEREKGRWRLNPADKIAIAYIVVITILVLIFSYRIPSWLAFCAGHAALVVFIVLIDRVLPFSPSPLLPLSPSPPLPISPSPLLPLSPSPPLPISPSPSRPLASLIRGWYPVVLIPVTYKELSYLIPLIHPRDFDTTLAAIDHRFLGVHPTVWLERFTWPPLTEVLQLTYSCYYFLPIILGVVLWRSGSFDKFHFWVFIVVLGFYLSYLGYIAVPAIGPRFLPSIVEAQTIPLTGVWLFHTIRETLDRAEGITRDCFPSGHTELTLLVLIYARAFHRKVFWWLLPLGTGVIVSTVYLRYHYVIDVGAGALLALAVVLVARALYGALGGREVEGL